MLLEYCDTCCGTQKSCEWLHQAEGSLENVSSDVRLTKGLGRWILWRFPRGQIRGPMKEHEGRNSCLEKPYTGHLVDIEEPVLVADYFCYPESASHLVFLFRPIGVEWVREMYCIKSRILNEFWCFWTFDHRRERILGDLDVFAGGGSSNKSLNTI